MGQRTGTRTRTGGQNSRFWKTTTNDRKTMGKMRAPAVVKPPQHQCAQCHEITSLLRPSRYTSGRVCVDCWAMLEWQSVLELVDTMPDQEAVAIGYDPTCGMKPKAEWAYDFMLEIWQSWMEAEVQAQRNAYIEQDGTITRIGMIGLIDEIGPRGFDYAANIYLHSVKGKLLDLKEHSYTPNNMAWFSATAHDYFKRLHYVQSNARIEPSKVEKEPIIKKPEPVKKPQTQPGKKPLTLLTQNMLQKLGGVVPDELPCAKEGCDTDLAPRFRYAIEHGICPSVFVYPKDDLFYCGPCFGTLPYYDESAEKDSKCQGQPSHTATSR